LQLRYILQQLIKNHKVANNSITTVAGENVSTYLESLEFLDIFT